MNEQVQAIKDEEKIIDALARALILISKNLVPNDYEPDDNENKYSGDNA